MKPDLVDWAGFALMLSASVFIASVSVGLLVQMVMSAMAGG
jgi:hypothetical protein